MCPTSFGVAVQHKREPNPPEGLAPTQAEIELAFKTQFQLIKSRFISFKILSNRPNQLPKQALAKSR